ncbi:MAG: methyltransferase domain-containing protein [Pseudomonadota bacterium]
MPGENYQISGNAAEIYEAQKVPAIFAPLAKKTLETVQLGPQDILLDVACGTGIVARTARQRFGPGPRIVGTDLNEGMIATARGLAGDDARTCEWHVADVTALPFPDATFSVAICQQGIQFFPDREGALREIHRVMQPGGRILISVWAGTSEFFTALAAALGRIISAEVGERSLAPFAFDDLDGVVSICLDLRCVDVSTTGITIDRVIDDPQVAIPKEIFANPVGPAVQAAGDAAMREIVTETMEALSAFRHGSGLLVPQHAHLVQATAR